jgi:hypothetical protein
MERLLAQESKEKIHEERAAVRGLRSTVHDACGHIEEAI